MPVWSANKNWLYSGCTAGSCLMMRRKERRLQTAWEQVTPSWQERKEPICSEENASLGVPHSPGELAPLYQTYEEAEQLCAGQARILIMSAGWEEKDSMKKLRETLHPENNYPCFLCHLGSTGGMLSAQSVDSVQQLSRRFFIERVSTH